VRVKKFLKWTVQALVLLYSVIAITALTSNKFKAERLVEILPVILLLAIGLGALFYIVEEYIIPWRKKKIAQKLVRIFNGKQISDEVTEFSLYGFTFYTYYHFDLKMSRYGGTKEIISFHIPREQISNLTRKPKVTLSPDFCNGIATYRVDQAKGGALGLAKRRLLKRFDPGNYYSG
jgi:hypothetical protein